MMQCVFPHEMEFMTVLSRDTPYKPVLARLIYNRDLFMRSHIEHEAAIYNFSHDTLPHL
jgi:hypothetical protein